jgi:hypothetical protein
MTMNEMKVFQDRMMESAMVGSFAVDEAKAWDGYVTSILKFLSTQPDLVQAVATQLKDVANPIDKQITATVHLSVTIADDLLTYRRDRFGAKSVKDAISDALAPAARATCGKLTRKGGLCVREPDHDGECLMMVGLGEQRAATEFTQEELLGRVPVSPLDRR